MAFFFLEAFRAKAVREGQQGVCAERVSADWARILIRRKRYCNCRCQGQAQGVQGGGWIAVALAVAGAGRGEKSFQLALDKSFFIFKPYDSTTTTTTTDHDSNRPRSKMGDAMRCGAVYNDGRIHRSCCCYVI